MGDQDTGEKGREGGREEEKVGGQDTEKEMAGEEGNEGGREGGKEGEAVVGNKEQLERRNRA